MKKDNKPDPFVLFCFYHLGVDQEGRYKFRNISHTAAYFNSTQEEILKWLKEARIDPETIRKVDFNLSKAHVDAQMLALTGSKEDVLSFARKKYQEYLDAMGRSNFKKEYFDVNYDDIFDEKS